MIVQLIRKAHQGCNNSIVNMTNRRTMLYANYCMIILCKILCKHKMCFNLDPFHILLTSSQKAMKAQVYHSTKTFSYTAKQPHGDRKLSKQTKILLRYRKNPL